MAEEADPTAEVEPDAHVSDDDDPAAEPDQDGAAPTALTRDDLQPEGGRNLERIGLGVLVAAILLMVGFVVGRTTGPDGDEGDQAAATTLPLTAAYPAGDQDRTGYWRFAGIEAAVVDDFERPDGELGTNADGDVWNDAVGTWAIADGHAVVTENGDGPSLAILPGGATNRLTEATMIVVEPGAGIVFRYRDPSNYWSLTANPEHGGWTLAVTFDGEREEVTNIGGATVDGTSVGVAQRGDELQLLVDGLEATRITDDRLSQHARSGLVVAADGDGSAQFDRFYVGDIAVTG